MAALRGIGPKINESGRKKTRRRQETPFFWADPFEKKEIELKKRLYSARGAHVPRALAWASALAPLGYTNLARSTTDVHRKKITHPVLPTCIRSQDLIQGAQSCSSGSLSKPSLASACNAATSLAWICTSPRASCSADSTQCFCCSSPAGLAGPTRHTQASEGYGQADHLGGFFAHSGSSCEGHGTRASICSGGGQLVEFQRWLDGWWKRLQMAWR